MLFDRADGAITLCEIKYTDKPFVIDKLYAQNLENKKSVFLAETRVKKQIFIAMISANGLKANPYAKSLIDQVVRLEDLFG